MKTSATSFAAEKREGFLRPLFGEIVELDIAVHAVHDAGGAKFGEALIEFLAGEAECVCVVFVAEGEDGIEKCAHGS